MSGLLWALVGLPALAGGTLVASAAVRSRAIERAAPAVAVVTAAIALALAVPVAVAGPSASAPFLPSAPLSLAVDGLAGTVAVTVAAVTLLVLLAAAGEIGYAQARFHGLMLLFSAAALLTVVAATLPGLLLAWEIMGATSYALIAHHWRKGRRVNSGTIAFLVTRVGDLGLYLAAGAALAAGAGLHLDGLAHLAGPWRQVAAAGVLAAGFGKAAQLPFSFWLSRAMDGPSPVSALLHSAAMVAMGGYLLLRLAPLLEAAGWAAGVAAWGGAVTALVLGAVAFAQSDLKQLLAASTCAQLGFVVLGAGAAAYGGVTAGTAHLIGHAAVKSLLFLAAGAWLVALGTQQLAALRGAGRTYPLVGATFAVAALALAGVAPLSLWATKDEVLTAAGGRSLPLYLVALAAAMLSAGYAGKALGLIVVRSGYERPATPPMSPLIRVSLVVLAAGAAVLGVLTLLPVGDILGEPTPTPAVEELALSGLLALAVAGLAAIAPLRLLPAPAWARAWLGLETGMRTVVLRPVLALATTLARFDDRGLDAGVHQVAAGARRLGQFARRPQTGQLHHYYIQAVVLLAGALVLLLVVS